MECGKGQTRNEDRMTILVGYSLSNSSSDANKTRLSDCKNSEEDHDSRHQGCLDNLWSLSLSVSTHPQIHLKGFDVLF